MAHAFNSSAQEAEAEADKSLSLMTASATQKSPVSKDKPKECDFFLFVKPINAYFLDFFFINIIVRAMSW